MKRYLSDAPMHMRTAVIWRKQAAKNADLPTFRRDCVESAKEAIERAKNDRLAALATGSGFLAVR